MTISIDDVSCRADRHTMVGIFVEVRFDKDPFHEWVCADKAWLDEVEFDKIADFGCLDGWLLETFLLRRCDL
jgi:hypothetical protein